MYFNLACYGPDPEYKGRRAAETPLNYELKTMSGQVGKPRNEAAKTLAKQACERKKNQS